MFTFVYIQKDLLRKLKWQNGLHLSWDTIFHRISMRYSNKVDTCGALTYPTAQQKAAFLKFHGVSLFFRQTQ